MKTTRKAALVVATVGLAMGASAGTAFADAGAEAAAVGSPGLISGNNIQVPIHLPLNVCGNTIDIIALANPAQGNTCVNADGPSKGHHGKGHSGKTHR